MRTTLVLGAIAALFAMLTTVRSAVADTETAEREFRSGQARFDLQDFQGALSHYQAAYQADAIPALVFNIAQCYRNLGDYRKAAEAFRKYLVEADNPSNRSEVQETLEQLDLLRKAQRHVRARRYEKAVGLFDRALEIERLAPIYRDRARSLERVGKYEEAIDSYRDYLSRRPRADDKTEIEDAIKRLKEETKVNVPAIGATAETDEAAPVYKKWWFWGAIAGVAATALVVSALAADDGVPNSDLGNVPF